jgi:DNA-binding LytR/AlgR family response regulator
MMNCLIVDDDSLSRHIIQEYIERTDFLHLIASCSSAIEAVNIIRYENIDLIFLDVEMPEMSGLEFIKTLDAKPQIILVTAHEKYAVEAFDYEVTDFIVKPIAYSRFLKAVSKAKREKSARQNTPSNLNSIFVKIESRIIKINIKDIIFIEALADYIMLVTTAEKYIVHSTMKGIENKLPAKDFMRFHRSYIVRLDRIESIDENTLIINRKLIPIGGSYRKYLMEQITLI